MIKIGITGGIACGKSTILSYIKTQGYTIFSADEAFKSIFEREDVQNWINSQIKTRKGEEEFKKYIGAEKTLLRYYIFSDPEFKKDYESLVHPMVKIAMLESNADIAEVPLLFETNSEDCFKYIWTVACDLETQINRVMNRWHCSREYALAWINLQIPQKDKIALSHRVIYTDCDINEVYKIVTQALIDDF
mgnify:CR=1 FL=1